MPTIGEASVGLLLLYSLWLARSFLMIYERDIADRAMERKVQERRTVLWWQIYKKCSECTRRDHS
jgi:hypothetical protein